MNDYFNRIVHPENVGQPAFAAVPLESSWPAEFGTDKAANDIVELDFESLPQTAETPTPRQSAVPDSEPAQRLRPHSPEAIDMPGNVRTMAAPPLQNPDPAPPPTPAELPDGEVRIPHPAPSSTASLARHMVPAPGSAPATILSDAAPKTLVPEVAATTPADIDATSPPREARVAFEHALRWVRSTAIAQDEDEAAPASAGQSSSPGVAPTDPPIRTSEAADTSPLPWPPEHPPAKRTARHAAPAAHAQDRESEGVEEEDTVMLSIGAIHVRLEAPQSPTSARPEPRRRSDPTPSAPAQATLATGLRRRCIHL